MTYRYSYKMLKLVRRAFRGLSLRWDPSFVPNLVMCIWIVFVWKGIWSLVDLYFLPSYPFAGNILAILIGVFIIYLPDNSFSQLWWIDQKDNIANEIAEEVTEQITKILK